MSHDDPVGPRLIEAALAALATGDDATTEIARGRRTAVIDWCAATADWLARLAARSVEAERSVGVVVADAAAARRGPDSLPTAPPGSPIVAYNHFWDPSRLLLGSG
jgi:hypothetical protein